MSILLGLPWDHGQKVVFSVWFFFLNKSYYALMAMCQAVPARSACLPGKPAWAPREWSWLEALRHSSVQVKSSPSRNSLINCSHQYTAVQKCKVIIITGWPAALPTAEPQNMACTPLNACHHGSTLTQEIKRSLLLSGEICLTHQVCSPPELHEQWT